MAAPAVMLLAAFLGAEAPANIEVGWRPLPGGGMQYLIQIHPLTVEVLRAGQAIESDIPPQVKDVRGFQIGIGTDRLPRIDPPVVSVPPTGNKPADAANPPPDGVSRRTTLGGFGSPGVSFSPRAAGPESAAPATAQGPKTPPWVTERPSGSDKDDPPRQLPADFTPRPFSEKSIPKSPPGKASAATFEQWVGNKGKEGAEKEAPPPQNNAAADAPPNRPWTALTLALAGLFGSLGGNVYLGWLLVETRRRYRAAIRRLKRAENHEDWDAPPVEENYRRDTHAEPQEEP